MNNVKIPHNALVFVGDGRKALFLRNDGDAITPHLRTEKIFEGENPSTHEQGSDRPGRVTAAGSEGRRSAVEPTDWHVKACIIAEINKDLTKHSIREIEKHLMSGA